MTPLIAALQFLTLLPLGKPRKTDPEKLVFFFPVAGFVIGGVLVFFDLLFLHFGSAVTAASLDVALLALVTGALHLDGLADTADGLLAHREREKALTIMKDSRVGAMGLVVTICALLIKWSGLMGLEMHRNLCLFIVPAYARAVIIPALFLLPYGRPEGGTGTFLFEKPLRPWILSGVLIPVIASLQLGDRAFWVNSAFLCIGSALVFFYRRRMGCITGDMMGAMVEIMESGLFCILSMGDLG